MYVKHKWDTVCERPEGRRQATVAAWLTVIGGPHKSHVAAGG